MFCLDNIAILEDNGDCISYDALYQEGDELANVIGKRCLVFLLCKNSIASMIGYTAFLRHKIVPVLLNSNLDQELLDHLLEIYHPKYLWLPENCAGRFSHMDQIYVSRGYCLLKSDFRHTYSLHPSLALLLTTSGSTGSPKFVRQSYTNIRSNTESIVKYLQINENERAITTLPMNYTYGLSIINTHLFVGGTILATESSIMQREFWHFLKDEKATSFGGVPYTYEMLDRIRFQRMDLPYFKTMTQAGGKLTPELHKKFADYAASTGKKFVVMYGQCEATARMGYLPPEYALKKCGSMGIAIPGGKFHLVDENGSAIETPFMTGELVYEGENVTLGYAECGEDLSRGDERNGVLETGDMAQFDQDGYYYIVGRKKRFLKIYGNRVNLDEVERLVKGAFPGIDCACAGEDDHLVIFLTDSSFADPVKQFVISKTKLNHLAFVVKIIGKIPKNDAGKTLYLELKNLL